MRCDFIFDTWAYAPEAVRGLLGALAEPPERYLLVSSPSVYGCFSEPCVTEDARASTATAEDLAVARDLPAHRRADADA